MRSAYLLMRLLVRCLFPSAGESRSQGALDQSILRGRNADRTASGEFAFIVAFRFATWTMSELIRLRLCCRCYCTKRNSTTRTKCYKLRISSKQIFPRYSASALTTYDTASGVVLTGTACILIPECARAGDTSTCVLHPSRIRNGANAF